MLFLYVPLLILSLLISLFMLYTLTKHDFVLARKSILLQEIFDAEFFAFLSFLLFGRIFYILADLKFSYIHVLRFFHLLNFPGVNFLGGVLGFYLIIFIFFSRKKVISRIFDIYSLSLYPIFLFALVASLNIGYFLYFNLLIFILSLIYLGVAIHSYKNYTLKDGSIALLFMCLISVFTIASEFSQSKGEVLYFFDITQIISVFVFFISAGILLTREGLIKGRKK